MKPALRHARSAPLALASALVATGLLLVLSGCGQRPRPSISIAGRHEHVPAGTTLAEAAALFRLHPNDRTEPQRCQSVLVRRGSLSDPQFLLSRRPGVEVAVLGALSHELVSVRFRPNGRQPTLERALALTFDDGPSATGVRSGLVAARSAGGGSPRSDAVAVRAG